MEHKIIFATGNEGKMKEIREILGDLKVPVESMKEANIDIDIEENGTTFEENSLIKATEVAKHTEAIVLADDSGLEIDALDKEPGVHSARYLGEDTPYDIKNKEILIRMDDVSWTKRTARFVCAITAVFPDGLHKTVRATMEGLIGYEAAGENGFGYDPIFYVPEFDCTSAQLTMEQKNKISHRGKALEMIKEEIKKHL
ncbi:MAG: XTP/dITP diphosphatase [Eubacterium sp.]|nr:XTP/dITP diphosphatase [Eubacterium sp.]